MRNQCWLHRRIGGPHPERGQDNTKRMDSRRDDIVEADENGRGGGATPHARAPGRGSAVWRRAHARPHEEDGGERVTEMVNPLEPQGQMEVEVGVVPV